MKTKRNSIKRKISICVKHILWYTRLAPASRSFHGPARRGEPNVDSEFQPTIIRSKIDESPIVRPKIVREIAGCRSPVGPDCGTRSVRAGRHGGRQRPSAEYIYASRSKDRHQLPGNVDLSQWFSGVSGSSSGPAGGGAALRQRPRFATSRRTAIVGIDGRRVWNRYLGSCRRDGGRNRRMHGWYR